MKLDAHALSARIGDEMEKAGFTKDVLFSLDTISIVCLLSLDDEVRRRLIRECTKEPVE